MKRVERLRREIEAMERLASTGAPVPEVVEKDLGVSKNPWYVMPWYERGSLESVVTASRDEVSTRSRLQLADEIASALSQIHEQGYAHRDVKPANILMAEDRVLIADFGLCISEEDTRLTTTYEAVGPWRFMAPEIEEGFCEGQLYPADFYSWAKLTWSLLAGHYPPIRERQLDSKKRLEIVLNDDRLSGLHQLFEQLLKEDAGLRLDSWDVVREDLALTIAKFDHVVPKADKSAGLKEILPAVRRLAVREGASGRVAEEELRRNRRNQAKVLEEYMNVELRSMLDAEFAEFNDAAEGLALVVVSAGLHNLSAIIKHTDYQPIEGLDEFSTLDSSRALIILRWDSVDGLDTNLQIMLHTLVEDRFVRFLRVSLLEQADSMPFRFNAVPDANLISDPLIIGPASTEAAARAFAREAGDFARDCIDRWVRLMNRGEDPYAAAQWE